MECIGSDFGQDDFDRLANELVFLEMKACIEEDTEEDRKRIKEIKEILKKELG